MRLPPNPSFPRLYICPSFNSPPILLCLLAVILLACPNGLASEAPWGTLRATIRDAKTGDLTACTVRITDAKGQVVLESESFLGGFRSHGQFTRKLPAGPTRIRVTRGFETRAVERVVAIPEGGDVPVEILLERLVDLRRRGWYSGDSHAHMIHGERTMPVDFDSIALAARAEDLQYMSLAQAWQMEQPTPEKLEAELGSRSRPDCVLTWNLEAPKNYYLGDAGRCLGHCWMLGVPGRTPDGQDVISCLLEASAHDYEHAKPSFANFESHRLIRQQGGAAFYTHPARWWMGSWGGQGPYPKRENMRISNLAVELPLDTLLGPTYDGVDVITGSGEFQANAMAFQLWCLLLNHGYRVAATASSDSCFDRRGGALPGVVRTYTFLTEAFSLPAVTRATARGHTFVTSGPLLLASVSGAPPGSSVAANDNVHLLEVEAWASGSDAKGLTRLELLRNGVPVQTNLFITPVPRFSTNFALAETEAAWYCVRVFGGDPQRERALTGAFFFDPSPYRPRAPVPVRAHIRLVDASTGQLLPGSVTEILFATRLSQEGKTHAIQDGEDHLVFPGHARLRAESAGYQPLTLSPFFDFPPLLQYVAELKAEDLVEWKTFEQVRQLLGEVQLTFPLRRINP